MSDHLKCNFCTLRALELTCPENMQIVVVPPTRVGKWVKVYRVPKKRKLKAGDRWIANFMELTDRCAC